MSSSDADAVATRRTKMTILSIAAGVVSVSYLVAQYRRALKSKGLDNDDDDAAPEASAAPSSTSTTDADADAATAAAAAAAASGRAPLELAQFRYAWEVQAYMRMAGLRFRERNLRYPTSLCGTFGRGDWAISATTTSSGYSPLHLGAQFGAPPFLQHGAHVMSGVDACLAYVQALPGGDLEADKDAAQRDDVVAWVAAVRELARFVEHRRWADVKVARRRTLPELEAIFPTPLCWILPGQLQAQACAGLRAGCGTMRSVPALGWESSEAMDDELRAAYARLVRKYQRRPAGADFFLGDKPGALDAAVFGHLAEAMSTGLGLGRILREPPFRPLMRFFRRVRARYFDLPPTTRPGGEDNEDDEDDNEDDNEDVDCSNKTPSQTTAPRQALTTNVLLRLRLRACRLAYPAHMTGDRAGILSPIQRWWHRCWHGVQPSLACHDAWLPVVWSPPNDTATTAAATAAAEAEDDGMYAFEFARARARHARARSGSARAASPGADMTGGDEDEDKKTPEELKEERRSTLWLAAAGATVVVYGLANSTFVWQLLAAALGFEIVIEEEMMLMDGDEE